MHQKVKAEMRAQKNKVWSKSKTRIVESNDKIDPHPNKASLEPKVYPSLEVSPALREARLSLEKFTPDQDIRMNLVSKWAK